MWLIITRLTKTQVLNWIINRYSAKETPGKTNLCLTFTSCHCGCKCGAACAEDSLNSLCWQLVLCIFMNHNNIQYFPAMATLLLYSTLTLYCYSVWKYLYNVSINAHCFIWNIRPLQESHVLLLIIKISIFWLTLKMCFKNIIF